MIALAIVCMVLYGVAVNLELFAQLCDAGHSEDHSMSAVPFYSPDECINMQKSAKTD